MSALQEVKEFQKRERAKRRAVRALSTVKIWDAITHRTKMVAPHPGIVTCGDCGRSWDDTIVTGITPTPAGRCPFEGTRRYRRVR